ncbi:hypothetical protein DAETH_42990 (plasmid) [Deinococcus aetherius]|uniref:Uncharacterized protein n=1 Tax=Deinococcus aetherius TaxID=200252 RepID=A0ABM8AKI3_9DEIO|nr:hypothetical protein DAETH_42990 [Deinococcus aetherius]
MLDPSNRHADLVEMPPGTPSGLLVTQFLSEQGSKFDVPLAQGLVADLDAALEEQLLDIPLAKGEAVVQPQGVADDAQGETVAVGLPVGHRSAAYRG